MTRLFRRLMFGVMLLGWGGGAFAQPKSLSGAGVEAAPDQETLRRMALQLGTGQGQPPIDPQMLEWAKEFLKNNPNITNDPAFQQKLAEMRQQAAQNPNFAEQLKSQISPQQLEQFKQQFPNGVGNGQGFNPQPNNNTGGPPPSPIPDRVPQGNGTNQKQGGPTGQTLPNGLPQGMPQIDPKNLQPPKLNPLDPNAAKKLAEQNQDFSKVAGMWEANFGSLDNTPALKQSLVEMFSGNGQSPLSGFGGANGNNPFSGVNGSGQGGKSFWDDGRAGNNGQGGFANWFKNATANGGPSWWKNMTNSSGPSWMKGWSNSFSAPSTPSGFGGGGSGLGSVGGIGATGGSVAGLGTVGLVLVFLALAAVIAFLVYRYWPQIQALRNKPQAIPGLGEWPIDPRDVKDRETLVRAFEYFSVFLCGDGARVWNHVTIAEAFRENVPASAPFADQLARLYAVARYTPAREEIAPADLAAARRYLCTLAGVSEA